MSARGGVPAAGRGSQINPDQSMHAVELATTPLARPTGIDAIDGFTSPLGIASLAAGGYGIARAGIAGGAIAGAKEALATAAPALKYEATKTLLEKMGVPTPLAVTAAIAVSGYKKGAKASEASTAAPEVATASAAPVEAAPVGPTPQAGPTPGTAVPPPSAVSPPSVPMSPVPQAPSPEVMRRLSPATEAAVGPAIRMGPDGLLVGRPGGNPAMPDQKALNEAALAARRAALQTPAPAAKPTLLESEAVEYLKLLKSGKTAKEAMETIQAMRALGGMTDAERIAAQDARWLRGDVKAPSAETARAMRGARE